EVDQMIVAGVKDGAMGMIVDEIVRGAHADAFDQHGRHVAFRPAALAREMAVFHEVSGGRQRLAIAAAQRDAAIAGVENITAFHAMAAPSLDGDTRVADVANDTTGDAVAGTFLDFYGVAAGRFQS